MFIFLYVQESELGELSDRLEQREKELRSQEVLLQTKVCLRCSPSEQNRLLIAFASCQAADLKRRRKQLEEEEEHVDRQIEVRTPPS